MLSQTSQRISPRVLKQSIINNAKNSLDNIIDDWIKQNSISGGQMRQLRGASIENFVINTINTIGTSLGIDIRAIKGDNDKKLLSISDFTHKHQVDVHVYHKKEFVAVIECKAYLDKCYYTRACDDFFLFKKFGYNVKNYIFAFEDSISNESRQFIDFVKDNICTDIFYMVDGKRSSSKPIYLEENKKEIVLENVTKFVNTIFDITQQ